MNYYNSCTSWEESDVHSDGGLCDMIEKAATITRKTFLKRVNRADLQMLENQLGYESHYTKGLTMASDWHVGYYKSTLHGKLCYFFKWSAIEFVFV